MVGYDDDIDPIAAIAMAKYMNKIDRRKEFAKRLDKVRDEAYELGYGKNISDQEIKFWVTLENFDGQKFSINELESLLGTDTRQNRWGSYW